MNIVSLLLTLLFATLSPCFSAKTVRRGRTYRCVEQALSPRDSDCVSPKVTQSRALMDIRDKWIVFYGESTLRQMFLQFIGIIDEKAWDRVPDQKGEMSIEIRKSGSRFSFHYAPYFANLTNAIKNPPVLFDGRKPDLIVLNDGLHDLLYAPSKMNDRWKELVKELRLAMSKERVSLLLWVPPSFLFDKHLQAHRLSSKVFKNATVHTMVKQQRLALKEIDGVYFYNVYGKCSAEEIPLFDGVHSMQRARTEAEGFVRALHWFDSDKRYWGQHPIEAGQIMCLLAYLIVVTLFVTGETSVFLFYRKVDSMSEAKEEDMIELGSIDPEKEGLIASESGEAEKHESDSKQAAVTSPTKVGSEAPTASQIKLQIHDIVRVLQLPASLSRIARVREAVTYYWEFRAMFRAMFAFGVCIVLVYLCDGPSHLFPPTLKRYDRDLFLFVHVIVLAVSGLTMKAEPRENKVLTGRRFTEEWKGLMQIVFVLYHYYDAAEVYNLVRVLIAAYVWMTGFGHTCYFLKYSVFSAVRVFGMLFRLNWCVLWVCLALSEPFMLYYICPLHTFYFLMVYATWGLLYTVNDKRWGVYLKMALCFCFLIVMFEIPGAFDVIWAPLAYVFPSIFQYHGTLYEWRFRTTLDHYAAWFGMLYGVCYGNLNAMLGVIESHARCAQIKAVIVAMVSVAVYCWYAYVYCHDKYTYNAMHPYTSFIPIFSYLILRNTNYAYRQYFSRFLIWMGQTTLETYIFQYHLYMIDDAKSILTVFADYPLINFLLVSVIYVYVSRVAFDSTDTLRNHFFPENRDDKCPYKNNKFMIWSAVKYVGVLVALYLVAATIKLIIG